MIKKNTVGIDEVGRGPIAGPTAVGAFTFCVPIKQSFFKKVKAPLRDSKKLSREEREIWFKHIKEWQKEGICRFSVKMMSAEKIDLEGISVCIKKALEQALKGVDADINQTILLDGGLKAPKQFLKQKTIIKGDEKEQVIALASIVAKVTRDRYMFRMAKKYPEYGFENHVGYGTKAHYLAIKKYGISEIHRRSFVY